MGELYFLIFWIPAAASAVSLRIAWGSGILNRPVVLLAWFAIALLLQVFTFRLSPGWTIGLVLQTILAVYLLIRLRLDL